MEALKLHEEKISIINWITELSDSSLIQQLTSLKEKNPPIPQWHIDEVRKNLALYNQDPSIAMDFDSAMDDIEKGL
jgi:hypothetical protein